MGCCGSSEADAPRQNDRNNNNNNRNDQQQNSPRDRNNNNNTAAVSSNNNNNSSNANASGSGQNTGANNNNSNSANTSTTNNNVNASTNNNTNNNATTNNNQSPERSSTTDPTPGSGSTPNTNNNNNNNPNSSAGGNNASTNQNNSNASQNNITTSPAQDNNNNNAASSNNNNNNNQSSSSPQQSGATPSTQAEAATTANNNNNANEAANNANQQNNNDQQNKNNNNANQVDENKRDDQNKQQQDQANNNNNAAATDANKDKDASNKDNNQQNKDNNTQQNNNNNNQQTNNNNQQQPANKNPTPNPAAALVPQEFAYVRDVVGEFAKIDASLRRRLRIEPEFAYYDTAAGKLVEAPKDSTGFGNNANNNNLPTNVVKVRRGSMVSTDENRILRLSIDVAARLLKAHTKLSSSAYFRQPSVLLYDDGQSSSESQHQKYTGLPTIAAADRSQELAGAHAMVSTIELLLHEAIRFIVQAGDLWKMPNADDDDDYDENENKNNNNNDGSKYASGSKVTMDTVCDAMTQKIFTTNQLWQAVADTISKSSSQQTSSSSQQAAQQANQSMHQRFATSVLTAVRIVFLAIGGTEFACSPNEHGVLPLPSLDILVTLLLKQITPILKARTVNRNRLRREVKKWMNLLAYLGLVPEQWDNHHNRPNLDTGASPFAQLPVFLLSPTATSQLLAIDFALRLDKDRPPMNIKQRTTAMQELLHALSKDSIVPNTLAQLRPNRDNSAFNAHRVVDAPMISPSYMGQIPYGYVKASTGGNNDQEIEIVPSPSEFEVRPAGSVSNFFETATKPYFGTDSRFGVKNPTPLGLHSLFRTITLEYCAMHVQDTEFDAIFTGREFEPDQPVQEKLVPSRVVLEKATDPLSFVQIASVDEGDLIMLDGESYTVHQREFKSVNDDEQEMPHAVFSAPTATSPADYKSVVLHIKLPFEAPPFPAKKEIIASSRDIDIKLQFARCLFAAPSVDYATFVVSNQLQGNADEMDNDSLLDSSNDVPGMTALIEHRQASPLGEMGRIRSADDTLRQQQAAYMLGWLIGSAIASGASVTVPLPALLFRVMKTFVHRISDEATEVTHHCLFQASEADVLEMMPRISAVIDDIRRLSTMRFIDLVRMEGLGSIMTKDEYITSIIAEPIVFPLTSFPIYEAIFTGMYDSGLCNSPLWVWSSPLTQQRMVTTTCLEDDDRNAPDFDTRGWDIRVGFMPFAPDAAALEEKFSEIVEKVITTLSPMHKRELLRKSLGLLRPPAGSDHVFSVSVAIGSLELEQGPTANDFEEEKHETPFVRPMDNILRVPNYLEALLFRQEGMYWEWFPKRKPANAQTRISADVLDNGINDLNMDQLQDLIDAVTKLTMDRTMEFLIPQQRNGTPGNRTPNDGELNANPLEPM